MLKTVCALLGLGILGGCASFLPHQQFSDDEVKSNAASFAYLVTCADRGLAPKEDVYRFGIAYNQLLSVSAYNKSLYEKTFQEYMEGYTNDFPAQMAAMCVSIPRELPRITELALQKHASIMAARNVAIQGMASSLATYSPGTPSYYQPQLILNNTQPAFGPTTTGSNNYLINSDKGLSLCNVSQSGYVRCN